MRPRRIHEMISRSLKKKDIWEAHLEILWEKNVGRAFRHSDYAHEYSPANCDIYFSVTRYGAHLGLLDFQLRDADVHT